jgi:NAD(P)-dependent dehydrogenase (short-subunit alcohol dehydrogenase family)
MVKRHQNCVRATVGSRSGGVKSQADSHATAFQAASSQFSAIDVVVNNAGIGLGGPLEAVSPDQLREHLEVNVVGVAAVCQAAAAHMRSHGEGLIINVTSLAGRAGIPFLAPYCAAKFAVEGLTEALYCELLHEATGSPIAAEALRRIAELYAIERSIRGRSAEESRHVRNTSARPLTKMMKPWLEIVEFDAAVIEESGEGGQRASA